MGVNWQGNNSMVKIRCPNDFLFLLFPWELNLVMHGCILRRKGRGRRNGLESWSEVHLPDWTTQPLTEDGRSVATSAEEPLKVLGFLLPPAAARSDANSS